MSYLHSTVEKFPSKFGASQCNISTGALYENVELRLKLSFLVIIIRKETSNWNWIVIVERKYIFEVETPPHYTICPHDRIQ